MGRLPFAQSAWLLLALIGVSGCFLDRRGRSGPDGPGDDGGRAGDAGAAMDAGPASEAGPGDLDGCLPAAETCNGVDDDCDGRIDEDAADATTWYDDEDGDGFGADATARDACNPPGEPSVGVGGDCDEDSAAVHPGADETCNAVDDDCDGRIDEDAVDARTWYEDGDGDGFGADGTARNACDSSGGALVEAAGDCDDGSAAVHPDADETCNGIDDDCSRLVDDGEAACPCNPRRRPADDRSYLFCDGDLSWDGARARCLENGYDLVIIDDLDENDWVWSTASAITSHDWWIGLRDVGGGDYHWVDETAAWTGGSDGSAVGFTRFRDGYPDGSGPCVEIGSNVVADRAGGWNDASCGQSTEYVCEQP